MIQGRAILVVDLGNSSTKGCVLFGKNANTGLFRKRRFDIPNVFAPVQADYQVAAEYDSATSTILSVDTELNGVPVKGLFCNGEVQMKERPLTTIKPSATSKKFDLVSTVLSYRLAFLFACKEIMDMQRISDWKQLDVSWTVVTLLPPGDLEIGQSKIKDIVMDIKSVDATFPEVSVPIKVDDVKVLPEGYCAYTAVVYDEGRVFREDYKFLAGETVIIYDIGAGTTDCLIMQDNKLIQNSKYTVQQGGNNVFQLVRKKLQLKGLDLSDDDIRNGVIKGYVKDGAKQIDIVDIVNESKDEIAQKIISAFQDFLELTDIRVRSVGYVLICGGGSMQDSDCEGIVPLSDKVVDNFKMMSPNAELIEIPEHEVTKTNEDGEPYKTSERINPRELNLIGASILAELF